MGALVSSSFNSSTALAGFIARSLVKHRPHRNAKVNPADDLAKQRRYGQNVHVG